MGSILNAMSSVIKYIGVIGTVFGIIGTAGTILSFVRKNSALMRRLRGPFIFLVMVGVVVGGVLAANYFAPKPPEFPNAAANQTIEISLNSSSQGISDVDTLDPAKVGDSLSYQVSNLVFPNLLVLDKTLHLQPWAAKSFTRSDDGRHYTFHLWPTMTWSDGSPINSDTFAYAIDRALSPCTHAPNARYLFALLDARAFNSETCSDGVVEGPIQSLQNDPEGPAIEKPDRQTIIFNLPQAAPYFLYALTYAIASAVPPSAYDPTWTAGLTGHNGFGGNLYRITQHGQGTVTLVRNESFWGTKPELRQIIFDLKAGGSPDDDVNCVNLSACQVISTLSITYAAMNWSKAPFDDLRMRQAFALALDKTKFKDPYYSKPTNHIVPEGMPDYTNASLVGPDDTTSVTGDSAKAQGLAQAYAVDKCGGDLSHCAPVTLTYEEGWSGFADTALKVWQTAFPSLSISGHQVASGTFDDPNYVNTVQLWITGWIADYPDPQDFLSLQFLPEGFNVNSGTNGVENLMRQADVDLDPPSRAREYQSAEQKLVSQVAWIPIVQQLQPVGFKDYVANYHLTALDFPALETWQRIYIKKH